MSLGLALAALAQGAAAEIIAARFGDETTRYPHGVLGDKVEYASLRIERGAEDDPPRLVEVHLPQDRVFEDLAPRLWDVTGDGAPEVVVVETAVGEGAQLAVYNGEGRKIAQTPHIGQTNRWLAPIGAADLDGDGHIELAYIDRPHLAKTLRIWRFYYGKLEEVATAPGLTNHMIGQDFITSGLRDCGAGPEIVTVNADWSRIIVSRLEAGAIRQRDIGAFDATTRLDAALSCDLL